MAKNNSKFLDFIKRNAYYLAFVVCLAVLVMITVALIVSDNNKGALEVNGGGSQVEDDENSNQTPDDGGNGNQTPDDGGNGNQTPGGSGDGNEEEDNKPTAIIFDMPVANGEIIKDYVGASVIYNQTLGLYTGHKAIDFSAPEGTTVSCVYDGVIESISVSKIEGTSVIVDHGDGLKTVYNSIEAGEELVEGMTVLKGQALGSVSTNNKTEYLDGAHLHFEVLKDGEKVDPSSYFLSEGK
ncbi:MAG: M23 family metallopeptidase [Clostridia bacterium]|nr:M23 family metallopeptidase [Clostridia bacterium]